MGGRGLQHNPTNATSGFQRDRSSGRRTTKTWALTAASGGTVAFTASSQRARPSFCVAPAADGGAKRGLKLPLSSSSCSFDHQAAPPASYTVDVADSSSHSLLLLARAHLSSCLLPDGASTSLGGCRAEKFPATLKSPARAPPHETKTIIRQTRRSL